MTDPLHGRTRWATGHRHEIQRRLANQRCPTDQRCPTNQYCRSQPPPGVLWPLNVDDHQGVAMPDEVSVRGTVAEGFEGVREEFAAVLAEEPDEPGSQLAVHLHGRRVVDLWAGEGLTGDSLTAVYSSAKGAAHLVVALLVQDGVLRLDREVSFHWPEFAAEGKGALTLRQLLEHRSGVIGAEGGLSPAELADDRLAAARLAGQRPYWTPGEGYGYHALVIGALTGEVVRRATGRSIQELFEERVRQPYGLDLYLGLPEALEARYVPIRPPRPTEGRPAEAAVAAAAPNPLLIVALNQNGAVPTDLVEYANSRAVRALGPTSAGGVGNARGLAGMYAAALGGPDGRAPLLKPDTVAEFGLLRTPGTDLVTGEPDHFGLGFEAQHTRYPSLGPDAFGHGGAAGSQAFGDPRSGVAYGYTRRRFALAPGPAAENDRLVAAVLRAAGA